MTVWIFCLQTKHTVLYPYIPSRDHVSYGPLDEVSRLEHDAFEVSTVMHQFIFDVCSFLVFITILLYS